MVSEQMTNEEPNIKKKQELCFCKIPMYTSVDGVRYHNHTTRCAFDSMLLEYWLDRNSDRWKEIYDKHGI